METFVNGTTALLQTLQEELGSLQRNSFEENLVPIFLSASTSAIVLGESCILTELLARMSKGRQSVLDILYHLLSSEDTDF